MARVGFSRVSRHGAFVAALLVVMALGKGARAASFTWVGPAGGNWFTAANWSSGGQSGVPGPGDTATVTPGASVKADANVTVTNLYLGDGATLTGAGEVLATGTFTLVDATIGGTGGITIPISGQLDFESGSQSSANSIGTKAPKSSNANKRITNSGRIHVRNAQVNFGADFKNLAGASMELQSDCVLSVVQGSTGISFINTGTITRNQSAGMALVDIPFDNPGLVQVQTGTLGFAKGLTGNGEFKSQSGAVMSFEAGVHSFSGASKFNGAGKMRFNGASVTIGGTYDITGITEVNAGGVGFNGPVNNIGAQLNVNGGAATFSTGTISAATVNLNNGTLTGNANMTVNNALNWKAGFLSGNGTTTVPPSGLLNLSGAAAKTLQNRTLENRGRATWSDSGRIILTDGTTLSNGAGGVFYIQNDSIAAWSGSATRPVFSNLGTVYKYQTSGTTIFSEVAFNNSGLVDLRTGTLACNGGYTQTNGSTELNGGALSGNKTVSIKGGRLAGSGNIAADVSNSALFAPGHSPGMISILGNYTQTSTGTFNIEIGGLNAGSQFDQVNINGTATLDGTLNVSLVDGFVPLSSNAFKVMTFLSRLGDFKIKNGLKQSGGLYFGPQYSVTDLTLMADITSDATPPTVAFTQPAANGFTKSLSSIAGTVSDNAGGTGVSSVALSVQRRSDNKYWDTGSATWIGIAVSANPPTMAAGLAGGTWTIGSGLPSDAAVAEGLYTLRAVAYDNVFNSATLSINVTVDKQAPLSLAFVTPTANSAVSALSAMTVTAQDNAGGSGIAGVNLFINRVSDNSYWSRGAQTWVAASPSNPPIPAALSGTQWTCNSGLPAGSNLLDGGYTLSATTFDKAGNTKSAGITIAVDKTVPAAVSFTAPAAGAFLQRLTQSTGTATDNSGGSGITAVTVQLYRFADSVNGNTAGYWAGGTNWTTGYLAGTNERLATGTTSWSLTMPTLTPGLYRLRATAKDRAGNSTASGYVNFTIDAGVPATLDITTPASGAIVNMLTAMRATATDNLGGTGIVRVDMTLQRRSDNKYWTGSPTTGWGVSTILNTTLAGGYWSRTTGLPGGSNLPGGLYTIGAIAYDKAGNSKSTTSDFSVDTVLPNVAITQPAANNVYSNLAAATGSASDGGSGVQSVSVQLYRLGNPTLSVAAGYWAGGSNWSAGYTTANEILCTGTTNWSISLPTVAQGLEPSQYRIRATAKDGAGNSQSSVYVYFTIDPLAPASVTITTPAAAAIVTSLPSIKVAALDNNGGTGIASVSLVLKRRSDSRYWSGASITSWAAAPFNLPTTLSGGLWQLNSGLPAGADLLDGLYDIVATAYDKAGNDTVAANTIRVDITRPTVAIAVPVNSSVHQALSSVTGIADDAGSGVAAVTVQLYRLANAGTGATAGYWAGDSNWSAGYTAAVNEHLAAGTNDWNLTLPLPSQGLTPATYRLLATAKDRGGNTQASGYVYFTIDTIDPAAVAITSPANGAAIKTLASVTGTAADDAGGSGIARIDLFIHRLSDDLYWGGNALGWGAQTALPTTGTTSWTSSGLLPAGADLLAGDYEITATAFDKAGNNKSTTNAIVVDLTNPSVQVSTPQNNGNYGSLDTATGTASDDTGSGVASVTWQLYRFANPAAGSTAGFWAGGSTWTAGYSAANEIAALGTTDWSVSLPTSAQGFTAGQYRALATARDQAGNSSNSGYIYFYVDPNAPAIAFTTPSASILNSLSSISGTASDGGGGSGINSVVVAIHRLADDTYWTGDIGTGWGAQTPLVANGTTSWSLSAGILPTAADLAEGSYELIAAATDNAANSTSLTKTILVDKTAPQLTVTSPTAGTTYSSLPTADGTTDDSAGSGVVSVKVQLYRLSNAAGGITAGYWNGTSWDASYNAAVHERLATGTATWSIPMPTELDGFVLGQYRIKATAVDGAGNSTSSGYIYFSMSPAGQGGSSSSSMSSLSDIAADSGVVLSSANVNVEQQSVELVFSGALDARSAETLRIYSVLVTSGPDSSIDAVVTGAHYAAASHAVTLEVASNSLHSGDRVSLAWKNLRDKQGAILAGQAGPLKAE